MPGRPPSSILAPREALEIAGEGYVDDLSRLYRRADPPSAAEAEAAADAGRAGTLLGEADVVNGLRRVWSMDPRVRNDGAVLPVWQQGATQAAVGVGAWSFGVYQDESVLGLVSPWSVPSFEQVVPFVPDDPPEVTGPPVGSAAAS